jgi:uncharacterized protein
MNLWKLLLIVFLSGYGIIVALLYFFQTSLLFIPEKLDADHEFSLAPSDSELYLTTKDGQSINALYYKGTRDQVILYLHGNAGSLRTWQMAADNLREYGYNVLIIDYRGYGKSTGGITEAGLLLDAQAAYDHLRADCSAADIIVYGRSIGTGIAVHLASENVIGGLILEAPYTSIADLANEKFGIFFPSVYLKIRLNNLEKINSVSAPVYFIHGTHDQLISPAHSEKLFKTRAGKKKRTLIKGGGHNDLMAFPQYQTVIEDDLSVFFGLSR